MKCLKFIKLEKLPQNNTNRMEVSIIMPFTPVLDQGFNLPWINICPVVCKSWSHNYLPIVNLETNDILSTRRLWKQRLSVIVLDVA